MRRRPFQESDRRLSLPYGCSPGADEHRHGRHRRWTNVRIRPTLWLNGTTPGWFETMGIPLRSGRDFEAGDRVGSRPVAIVNGTFVRRFLPGEQPIGQSVRLGFEPDTRYEIVGVVGDTVYTTPREGMLATMYVAMAQRKPSEFWPPSC